MDVEYLRGIVISNTTPEDGGFSQVVYPTVLVLQDYKEVADFIFVPLKVRRFKNVQITNDEDDDQDPVSVKKRYDENLIYGSVIEWASKNERGEDVRIITEYNRRTQVYETRRHKNETQILLQGMMSKNRQVMWMLGMWPVLEVPIELRQCAHPNVVLDVWVNLQTDSRQKLTYKLSSFQGVSSFCPSTRPPWHTDDDGNLQQLEDPHSESKTSMMFVTPIQSSLTGMLGTVISNKMILPLEPKHRDICFHRLIVQDANPLPPVGTRVSFNAERNDYLNIYAINKVSQNHKDKERCSVSDQGYLNAVIRAEKEWPGFFFSKAYNIYLDDPNNYLEHWQLSQYCDSSLQVAITAGEPSDKGIPRYAVAGVTDLKRKNKLEELGADGKIKLQNELAIVIDTLGRLHFPRLPKTLIRLPKDARSKYPPGTILRVSAQWTTTWTILNFQKDSEATPIETDLECDPESEKEIVWFQVPVLQGCRELPFLLKSELFGMVQLPRHCRIRKNPENVVLRGRWITLNNAHPGDRLLPPAKFRVWGKNESDVYGTDALQYEQHGYTSTSYINETEYEFDAEDQLPEYAANNFRVPEVIQPISDETMDQNLAKEGVNLHQMVDRVKKNPRFRSDPAAVLEIEIRDHFKKCNNCYEGHFSERCFFPEFISEVIELEPEAMGALDRKETLTEVTIRRFRH